MIRFIEQRFGVMEPNITPWRRAICGDLTAALDFSLENTSLARMPSTTGYAPPATVMAQIQALSYNDIIQADNLNIQGVRRKMYIQGEVDGLVRPNNKGGDLVLLPDGSTWLVAMVDEHWPDWTAAIITLQNGA